MCTARPNWLSLSTTFFNKEACHKVPVPLYDILGLNEEKMTVNVEPMVSVGDITRYLVPKGYTLAVTLGAKYLDFFSSHSLKTRENVLVLLSLYIF